MKAFKEYYKKARNNRIWIFMRVVDFISAIIYCLSDLRDEITDFIARGYDWRVRDGYALVLLSIPTWFWWIFLIIPLSINSLIISALQIIQGVFYIPVWAYTLIFEFPASIHNGDFTCSQSTYKKGDEAKKHYCIDCTYSDKISPSCIRCKLYSLDNPNNDTCTYWEQKNKSK